MNWQDDSWRDGYDGWKLAAPYDDGPECDHDDYEVDILDGRCSCVCGHSWYASNEQVEAEIEHQRSYDEYEARERRLEFWRSLTHPIRWAIYRVLERVWPRKSLSVLTDDEIPF